MCCVSLVGSKLCSSYMINELYGELPVDDRNVASRSHETCFLAILYLKWGLISREASQCDCVLQKPRPGSLPDADSWTKNKTQITGSSVFLNTRILIVSSGGLLKIPQKNTHIPPLCIIFINTKSLCPVSTSTLNLCCVPTNTANNTMSLWNCPLLGTKRSVGVFNISNVYPTV